MKPAPFSYAAARNVDDAVSLMSRYGQACRIIAGGQSLMMNLRTVRPSVVVDIARIEELSHWRRDSNSTVIGAMVRQHQLETDKELRTALPLLADAVRCIGHVATRSRGTIVGSLCHADPAAELPVCAVALDATLVLRSKSGERTVPADEFFTGIFSTAVRDDELATAVRFPALPAGTLTAFEEIARRQGDFAMVSVACVARLHDTGAFAEVRLVFGGVGYGPVRARAAEQSLIGAKPDRERLANAARIAAAALSPYDDIHATSQYRTSIAAVLTERVLQRALDSYRERLKENVRTPKSD
jgi:CO/xanthine dehydrogenase FAD-binding subunit